MGRSRTGIVVVALCACLGSQRAHADVTPQDEYVRRLQVGQSIPAQGGNPFGEEVNAYTGELTFHQTDVVLEGTGPAIRLARNLRSFRNSDNSTVTPMLGDWLLSIPRIETLTDAPPDTQQITDPGLEWFVGGEGDLDRFKRCSKFDRPMFTGWLTDLDAGWNGITLFTEDGESQPVLKRSATNVLHPSIAEASLFPAVTTAGWQIGCLAATSNGATGEAFLAVSPDGTKYWFDHLVGERAYTMREQDPDGGTWLKQYRMLARMYVSRIEDRFGNYLLYHYSGDHLSSITASDGRSVSIAWRSDMPTIDAITVQAGATPSRSWHYQYVDTYYGPALSVVLLPDGSRWSYDLHDLGGVSLYDPFYCSTRSLGSSDPSYDSIVTAPSGLVGTFTVSPVWHARSYVPSGCVPDSSGAMHEGIPPLFGTYSLTRKLLSGPGMANRAWNYAYAPAVGSAARDACAQAGTCAETTWVDVTDPDGNRTRHTYSNRWGAWEGKELRTDAYQGTSSLLRTQTYAYAAADQGPWPATLGSLLTGALSNHALQETWTPLKSRVISQQGATFTWAATTFDGFARPLSVNRDSSLSAMRTEVTAYHDATSEWVLGQVASTTVNGIESARTDFNPQDLPWKAWAFGQLTQTLAYYADGTLKTVTDGNNRTTTLSNWYRGVPRLVTYADTTTQSVAVNPYGWITGVTDENDYTTSYDYDAMGRVNKITYPTGDTQDWNVTSITFLPVTSTTEHGIAAGHWRQTTSTGNGRKVTYFDALWRPVLTREYDAGDVAATDRYTATAYDPAGNVAYSAYPVAIAPTMVDGTWSLPGVHSTFDALGRVETVTQDSELGPLTTTTQYLSGFQRRTTDPRDNSTTEQFVAYDQPSFDQPTRIDAPEDTRTTITRDIFGKPLSITRGGQ